MIFGRSRLIHSRETSRERRTRRFRTDAGNSFERTLRFDTRFLGKCSPRLVLHHQTQMLPEFFGLSLEKAKIHKTLQKKCSFWDGKKHIRISRFSKSTDNGNDFFIRINIHKVRHKFFVFLFSCFLVVWFFETFSTSSKNLQNLVQFVFFNFFFLRTFKIRCSPRRA